MRKGQTKPQNINQRIVMYCKIARIKQVDLVTMGVGSKQAVNNVFHERNKPSCEFLELLAASDDNLNTRWLLTGKEKMFLEAAK